MCFKEIKKNMGLNLSFFRTPKHRVFNYRPLYYDERKEDLKERIENAQNWEKGEYVPGKSIRGSFGKIKYDVKRSDNSSKLRRILTLIALVMFMLALLYFSQFLGVFFNN